MNRDSFFTRLTIVVMGFLCLMSCVRKVGAQGPTLTNVYPAGGEVGTSVEVEISGDNLNKVRTLLCNAQAVRCERIDGNRFRLTVPAKTPPGQYDVWAIGENGVSAARTFWLGNRAERIEMEPNDSTGAAEPVPLDATINGRIEKPGDADHFRFEAKRGQRVIIECLAYRIDSRLRAVIELFDSAGKRLAVNRGYFEVDPLIDFVIPVDGSYIAKIHDLTESGSVENYYRLDIDTKPRIAFSLPSVVERGKAAHVTLFGWNLPNAKTEAAQSITALGFDQIEVEIPETQTYPSERLPVRQYPAQATVDGFAYHFPGSHASVMIGLTDVPVVRESIDSSRPETAQEIPIPCEVSGQLASGGGPDWYSIRAQRGDVIYIEAIGQRLNSPVDLQVGIFDNTGKTELAQFGDEFHNSSTVISTSHLDPCGRWVSPADGQYRIAVRNLIAGTQTDPRRIYRLNVRREEPDFQVIAFPMRTDPAALNVRRGGCEILELLAIRRRGMHEAIRVFAKDLPAGLECADVWLGPDVNRALLVVSADRNIEPLLGELKLEAESSRNCRPVRAATIVRTGTPNPWGRLVSKIPLSVAGEAVVRIRADGYEEMSHHLYGNLKATHAQGSVLDVAITIERPIAGPHPAVKLVGVGVPDDIANQTSIIAADEQKGYISFWLPRNLRPGRYSLVIKGETTISTADQKTETVVVYSEPVSFEVHSPVFAVEVDPFVVTRVKRGETFNIGYTVVRRNGFIGKTHTELAMPGKITNVVGLRGRGETFVGQTERGSLQVIVNDDAPLGRREFLRLFTVGTIEDQPIYQGSCLLSLEIIE